MDLGHQLLHLSTSSTKLEGVELISMFGKSTNQGGRKLVGVCVKVLFYNNDEIFILASLRKINIVSISYLTSNDCPFLHDLKKLQSYTKRERSAALSCGMAVLLYQELLILQN